MDKRTVSDIKMTVVSIKDAYDKAFGDNPAVLRDLRTFCNVDVPTNMNPNAGNIDPTKVFIKTGRASVWQRIEYWLNTPLEVIQQDEIRKWEQRR